MTEFEWRLKYAPNGYRFMTQKIDFERFYRTQSTIAAALDVRFIVTNTIEYLDHQLTLGGVRKGDIFTIIRLYPMEVGETLNHHDSLIPRFGIEIERRRHKLGTMRSVERR